MVNTIKFSQFNNANLNDSTTEIVGLATGQNIKTSKIVSWTTAGRPSPPPSWVIGANTDLQQYEFWDPLSSAWVQLTSSVNLTATFILKTPDGTLPNSFALSTLATGILKNTTGTGVPSISVPLTSIDSLTTIANEILYTTAPNTYAVTSLSPFSRGLLADTTALAWRTDLGVPSVPVSVSQGGTGDISFVPFSVITGGTTSTNPLQSVATVGLAGQVLTSNGAGSLPSWQNSASSGIVNPGLINELAYYAASGSAVSGLATANNGVLVTDNSGVPSISSTLPLAVQTNITELGTITLGTWQGSLVALAFGGTNANLTASAGAIVYSTASAFALSAVGTTGQLLQSNGAGAPSWTTATFPGTVGAAGTILRSNGTNWVASTATFADTYSASNILYSNGANAVVGLATANNGVLVTSGGGVPSISSTLPLAVQTNITELGTITVGVWNGSTIDVPHGGTGDTSFTAFSVICGGTTATGALQNVVGVGAVGQVLTSNGAGLLPSWANAPGTGTINSGLQNQLAYYAANGTTLSGLATAANGLLVTNASSAPSILAGPGTTGNVLQSNAAAAPSFSTATYPSTATSTGTILRANGTNWVASTSTFADTYTASNLLYSNGANTVTGLATANNGILATNGSGVPSITSTLPTAVLNNVTKVTIQTFTTGTAATYTTPSNATHIRVRCQGGGGGGGFGNNFGEGGGSGAYCESIITSPAASYTYTVGAGGAGATSGGANGTSGGATTFSAGSMSAGGGTGGGSLGGTLQIGAGGTATGGNIVNLPGFNGGSVVSDISAGVSGFGGGQGGGIPVVHGPGAGNAAVANSGGGGSGAIGTNSNNGGAGAAGYIVVEEYYVG